MNYEKLKEAEEQFLERYPGGFMNPEMQELVKKHTKQKLTALAQDVFAKDKFKNPSIITENMIKIVTRSSMVSVFEKPRFRDYVRDLPVKDQVTLSGGLMEFLHGKEETGFNMILEILIPGKIAKWSIITVWGIYYQPDYHVFCKPTTVKGIIEYLEIKDLVYNSKPSYEFYNKYRDIINTIKLKVDPSISIGNAAFSGFLMMSI